ncbi:alpha/beta fold hydrolase [Planomonospora venezuelensis]|uniref:Pimeloyl-ACP methyl ester carboxylesterase n=1 Tax=Planomonospora venezuelensis TaxID=1999 RepID=A0A841CXH9_PLAVE|nr:alpha/beta hydrolase [Planomonospora venezuelensis]MBB5962110.1 pimeloyl-ACP methyl ester carboxylesterase [Planomonospora venezuelensis]GIN00874.1 hydrolase [Planomonospora venezuelensis]
MTEPAIGRLRADGATLRYEVRGSGPLLLLIPGGTGGAASFDGVADGLAADHTVASYDPRGLSRSPLDDPQAPQRVAQHADDALRLLDLLSPDRPARVVGCSSGAIVALHLLATRPERIERVVAHEPPVVEVLPDAAEHRALLARVQDTFRRDGPMPAAAVFAAGLRRPGADPAGARAATGPPPQATARVERTMADMPYFLGRIVPSFMAYTPDVDRLEALSDRLVLAGGADSRGELPYRPAAFLAERFGTELVHFPGGHTGLSTHPAEFGELLREVLSA